MSFAYFPSFRGNKLADIYLKIIGYPYPSRRVEAEIVFDLLKLKTNERVLDVGCGEGIFTNYLAKTNNLVSGVDISTRNLSVAKASAHQLGCSVNYVQSDAAKMPFRNSSFDKVFSISTIEHISDDMSTFKEINRVLKPGGVFVFSVPLNSNPVLPCWAVSWSQSIKNLLTNSTITSSSSVSEYVKKIDLKYNHKRRYSLPLITDIMNQSGFKIIHIKYNPMLFGRFAHNLVHTFRIFEWEKNIKSGYKFNNGLLLGLIFPLFIFLYEIDRILGNYITIKGYNIVVEVKNKSKDPDEETKPNH